MSDMTASTPLQPVLVLILAHVGKKRLWQVQHCSRVHIKASIASAQAIRQTPACKVQHPTSNVQRPRSGAQGTAALICSFNEYGYTTTVKDYPIYYHFI